MLHPSRIRKDPRLTLPSRGHGVNGRVRLINVDTKGATRLVTLASSAWFYESETGRERGCWRGGVTCPPFSQSLTKPTLWNTTTICAAEEPASKKEKKIHCRRAKGMGRTWKSCVSIGGRSELWKDGREISLERNNTVDKYERERKANHFSEP